MHAAQQVSYMLKSEHDLKLKGCREIMRDGHLIFQAPDGQEFDEYDFAKEAVRRSRVCGRYNSLQICRPQPATTPSSARRTYTFTACGRTAWRRALTAWLHAGTPVHPGLLATLMRFDDSYKALGTFV